MTTLLGRDCSVYWGSTTPFLVPETRGVSVDMGADYVDDTVHGDTVRSFSPTFVNWGASVTGLWDVTMGKANEIVANALAKVSGKFSLYIGDISRYFTGSGYVSVDEVSGPYDDFSGFNWSIKPSATVTFYQK